MSYGMPPDQPPMTPPPPPPGYGAYPPGYAPQPPNHPRAVTILVLGILSILCCGPLGIVAWVMGNGAIREIDASQGALGGRGMVQAGRILGIIGTVFLAIGLVFFVVALGIGGFSSTSP